MAHVHKDGLPAAIMLAFLATAGLFYVNLGGAFLSAFVDGLGVSREDAGLITAANKYGAAFGALLSAILIKRLSWRVTIYCVLPSLIAIDLLSFLITDADILLAVRFLHGSFGGFSVGLGLAVIARTRDPDKGYGMLLVVQYTFGSLGIFAVPKLVEIFGHGAAFGALIVFSFITLLMIPFIPDYKAKESPAPLAKTGGKANFTPLILTMLAVYLFQASNMGIADYAFEIGKENGYKMADLSNLVAIANIISVIGAVCVYMIGTKYGRLKPIMLGLAVAAAFTFLFHWSNSITVYFIANTVTGICWAFVIPYLLGLGASFDLRGQIAALAGFVSKMGLASGPLIAALLVGENNFDQIINTATFGLILCACFVFYPARKAETSSTPQTPPTPQNPKNPMGDV